MATAGPGLDVHRPLLILEPLEKELIGIASEANRYGAELIAADQRELARLHRRLSGLIVGLIVCGLSLVGMLTWNNRLLVSAHRSLSRTTDDLKRRHPISRPPTRQSPSPTASSARRTGAWWRRRMRCARRTCSSTPR